MSPASRLKRALVTLLLHFARIYTVTIAVTRDSPDAAVRSAFRKVILKAHPDKAGGCAHAAQKLNTAYGSWQDAPRTVAKLAGQAAQQRRPTRKPWQACPTPPRREAKSTAYSRRRSCSPTRASLTWGLGCPSALFLKSGRRHGV